jgi:hypothetical protein
VIVTSFFLIAFPLPPFIVNNPLILAIPGPTSNVVAAEVLAAIVTAPDIFSVKAPLNVKLLAVAPNVIEVHAAAAVIVTVWLAAIVTSSPATGIPAGDQVAGTFQFPLATLLRATPLAERGFNTSKANIIAISLIDGNNNFESVNLENSVIYSITFDLKVYVIQSINYFVKSCYFLSNFVTVI